MSSGVYNDVTIELSDDDGVAGFNDGLKKGSRRSWTDLVLNSQTMKYGGSSVIINIPPVC